MTPEERIEALEAQVIAQQALLTAFAYKLVNSDPLSRVAYASLVDYSKQSSIDPQLATAARAALDRILASWPKNL
jgi:hypothetical protein